MVLVKDYSRLCANIDQLLIRRPDPKGLRFGVVMRGDLECTEFTRSIGIVEALMHLPCTPGPPLVLNWAIFNGISKRDSFKDAIG